MGTKPRKRSVWRIALFAVVQLTGTVVFLYAARNNAPGLLVISQPLLIVGVLGLLISVYAERFERYYPWYLKP
jgi:hypothetical protein